MGLEGSWAHYPDFCSLCCFFLVLFKSFFNLLLNCSSVAARTSCPTFPNFVWFQNEPCLIHWFFWSCKQRKKWSILVITPTAPMQEEQFPVLPSFPVFVSKDFTLNFPERFDYPIPLIFHHPRSSSCFLNWGFPKIFWSPGFCKVSLNHFFSSLLTKPFPVDCTFILVKWSPLSVIPWVSMFSDGESQQKLGWKNQISAKFPPTTSTLFLFATTLHEWI